MFKKAMKTLSELLVLRVRGVGKDVIAGAIVGRLAFIGAALGIMATIMPPAIVVVPVAIAAALAGGAAGVLTVKAFKRRKAKSAAKKEPPPTPHKASAGKPSLNGKSAEKKFNAAANNNKNSKPASTKPTATPKPPKAA